STIIKMDGVSTYLALIFGTLLSSQGTDASFVFTRETLSGFPPGASLRCFQPYQIRFPFRSRSEFISGGRWRAFCLRLPCGFPFGGSDFIRGF
ncbi:hypothetical protein ABT009_43845, partial [Streptomyces sp. NPDC002896]|uniref:hypothetical protein n=1 Tax=Streptomyces sp. NPDC002896 TaxID=3154438 RepID=UPI00332D5393